MDPPPTHVSVAVFPLPAQGHLNQLLLLARHISDCSIPVHYVGSSVHNRQARERADGWDPSSTSNLHFHDFPLPPYSCPPPNPSSASSTRFPTHLQPAFDACLHLASPLSSILRTISASSYRVILIHDSAMSFATSIASSIPNVESYAFHTVSAFTNLSFHLTSLHSPTLPPPTFEDCFSDEFLHFIRQQHNMIVKDHGRLLNTCRCIEGEFLDKLSLDPNWIGQKVFAVGPLNPIAIARPPAASSSISNEVLHWLDRQPSRSVLYVSFGTTSCLSGKQIAELASGLVDSGQRFVWVLRDADRGDIYAGGELETEREIEVGAASECERGMVVRGWAPQLEVLGHEATGGFLTHCGWNSCMESMSMGVPMLTWPMHSDQPQNAVLVTEVLKVGIVARGWSHRKETFASAAIRDSVVRLMAGDEGKEVRDRAKAVGVTIRRCGTDREELKSFIDYITK